ncbi:MAG: hypothetical protein IPL65_14425 [Lewinellaceae bacterium]|nr:hypothetical protein [Lewinellaceae bacterium]
MSEPRRSPAETVLISWQGCDSLVLQPFVVAVPDTIDLGQLGTINCTMSGIMHNGVLYDQAGVYFEQISACEYNRFSIDVDLAAPNVNLGPEQAGCNGSVFQLVAGNSTDGLLYNWSDGSSNPVLAVSPPDGVHTYTVTVTDPANGCSATDAVVVTQNADAVPVVLPPANICPGECFVFQGQTVCPQAGDPPLEAHFTNWQGCDSLVMQAFVFNQPDTVDLGLIGTINCISPGVVHHGQLYYQAGNYVQQISMCEYEMFSIAADMAAPVADIGPDLAGCGGSSYQLTAGTYNSGYLFEWSNGNTNPELLITPTDGVHTYAVTVTNPVNGCTVTDSVIITLYAAPAPTVLPPANVCPGECFVFQGETVCPQAGDPPLEAHFASWQGCDSLVQQMVVFQQADTVELGVISTLTCNLNAVMYNGVVYTQPGFYTAALDACTFEHFYIAQNIQAPVANAGPDLSICMPETIQVSVQNPEPGLAYSWSNGDTGTFTNITPEATTTVVLQATDPATGCFASDTVQVFVQETQVVNMGLMASITCKTPVVSVGGHEFSAPGTYVYSEGCTDSLFMIGLDTLAPNPNR